MQKNNFKKSGFTLIELLVVVAIISLLSSIILVSLNSARAKARDAKRIEDLHQISIALEMFYDQQGRYPVTPGGTYWDAFDPNTSHMRYFADCLESGTYCGFTPTNYKPVMSQVPLNPSDDPNKSDGFNSTYFFGYEGRGPECYILGTLLETNSSILKSDADGDIRVAGDNGCNDPYYCIKQNWPCS